MYEKILIQGELTLDIPIDECLGEEGGICFQITVLPNKKEKENNESKDKKAAKGMSISEKKGLPSHL